MKYLLLKSFVLSLLLQVRVSFQVLFLFIAAISVSARTVIFSPETSRRSALILICLGDSSPETYNIDVSSFMYLHICSKIVDFPMPGSPLMTTRDPFTILLRELCRFFLSLWRFCFRQNILFL